MKTPLSKKGTDGIEAALQHLHVLPDLSGFEWFGVSYLTPESSAEGFTTSDRCNSLVETLSGCLYGNYYCTGVARPYVEQSPFDTKPGHSRFVQTILKANCTRIAWSEMKVLRVTRSVVIGSYGGIAIHANRASPLLQTKDGRKLPVAENAKFPSVIIAGSRSWTLSASPGFILMMGQREPFDTRKIQRAYWNLHHVGAPGFVAAATHNLNIRNVPFRLKVIAEPGFYGRRLDTGVIYLDLRTSNAQEALVEIYRANWQHLREGVPALTYAIAPGFAIAENPGEGLSFGMNRCRLVAEACVQAAERKLTRRRDVMACVEKVFARHGIDLKHPHRLAVSDDCYTRELETVIHRIPRPETVRPRLRPEVPFEKPWLAIATEIGRRLISEAFKDNSRCQWVGGHMLSSRKLVFRTLGASLYDGTAGIGHFLAELAARTNSEEAASTALDAMRQALATSRGDGFGGLYSGSLGVAIVVLRAARRLGDPGLVDQASSLAYRLLPMISEQSPDLLCGLAGQVVGLLVMARLLADEQFKDRAITIGEVLIKRASQDRGGLSWPNREVESDHNLTGLSHGAAGIALALGEIWKCTGERLFLDAVNKAIVYEDASFNEHHSNWPDYRLSGKMKGRPTFPTFWCHGAAGIILSRLRIASLFGLDELPHRVIAAIECLRRSVETSLDQRHANFTLCHGVAGNTEILWEASQWRGGAANWQPHAAVTAAASWRIGETIHSTSQIWHCGAIADNPSLMLGRAGIGYAYLRLHDPSVPSILAADPSIWSHK